MQILFLQTLLHGHINATCNLTKRQKWLSYFGCWTDHYWPPPLTTGEHLNLTSDSNLTTCESVEWNTDTITAWEAALDSWPIELTTIRMCRRHQQKIAPFNMTAIWEWSLGHSSPADELFCFHNFAFTQVNKSLSSRIITTTRLPCLSFLH